MSFSAHQLVVCGIILILLVWIFYMLLCSQVGHSKTFETRSNNHAFWSLRHLGGKEKIIIYDWTCHWCIFTLLTHFNTQSWIKPEASWNRGTERLCVFTFRSWFFLHKVTAAAEYPSRSEGRHSAAGTSARVSCCWCGSWWGARGRKRRAWG